MKKIFLLLFVMFCGSLFAQPITVNTTSYTVDQLVNDVLINTPCVTAQNIVYRTGTTFGSANGIGYFTNSNPNFPMTSGVILSTGDVLQAHGPNTSVQNAGNLTWIGDSNLEATMAAAGFPMVSKNATVLEFEFTPISPNFDFKFLFASEEYGNSQCQFSDAFAFLLTEVSTGITTNLAVVPSTTLPISVVTIRDLAYNSSCPSANQQYFGLFNGGSAAANSATNFNGQTKLLTANAVLNVGSTYKIKLVIADRGDNQADSAIFLASSSFNIGQTVLEEDLTFANNTPVCNDETRVLTNSIVNPGDYTYVWKKDGSPIVPAETNPTLTVSQPGTYTVVCTNAVNPCRIITDDIVVEYRSPFSCPNPKNILKCDDGGTNYTFDLSYNTAIVTSGLPAGTTVSYHLSQNDADANTGALPLSYNTSISPIPTIYVRINNPTTGCHVVKTFQLNKTAAPVANQPNPYTLCALGGPFPTKARFLLNSVVTPEVLNGQPASDFIVKYYTTAAAAAAGGTSLPTTYSTVSTTLYIRLESAYDPTCFSTTTVTLTVIPLPPVTELDDLITCDSYTLQPITDGLYYTLPNGGGLNLAFGTVITETQTVYIYNYNTTTTCGSQSSFKITIVKASDLAIQSGSYCNSYTLPDLAFGEYRTQPGGAGTVIPPTTVITSSQTVYYFFTSAAPVPCAIDVPFTITITVAQAVINPANVFDCVSYTLPPLSFGEYRDAPGGFGNVIPVGTAITTSQTIYIYGLSGTCPSYGNFNVTIGTAGFPTSVTECVSYTLPQLPVGGYYTGPTGSGTQIAAGTVINTTQTIYVYAVSQSTPNCADSYNFTVTVTLPVLTVPTNTTGCDNYTLPALTVGNYFSEANGTGTPLFAGNVLTISQTIHVYINNGNGCQNDVPFDVVVNQTPLIDARSDITSCGPYTLTNITNGKYYTGPGGTGVELAGGSVISTSGNNVIYIYAINNGCAAENSFNVYVNNVDAYQPSDVTLCDSYTLPSLPGNNKYYTAPNGPNGTGSLLAPGTSITSTQTIYVYLAINDRILCKDEKSFLVTIYKTPNVLPIANVSTCNSYALQPLTVGNYFTAPGGIAGGGTMLHAGDILTTNQTIYVYADSGTTNPNCPKEESFTVTIYNVSDLPDVERCVNDPYILPNIAVGTYYNGPNGTGGTIAPGTPISSPQTVYIRGYSGPGSNCYDESQFDVTIYSLPVANPVPASDTTVCDTDGTNDGIYDFNLAPLENTVLGPGQSPTDFSVTYYANYSDAVAGNNPLGTTTTLTNIYVKVTNKSFSTCVDIQPLTIIVHKLPEPTPHDGVVCIDSVTNTLIKSYTINSGLNPLTNTFEWYDSLHNIIGTSSNYTAILPGVYSIIATNTTTTCPSNEVFVTVTQSEAPRVTYTTNEDFTDEPVLTITATGVGGDYEYQLDEGPFQDSPIFNGVTGPHFVTVRDKNGCGSTTIEIMSLNFQRFFSPNSDGNNDLWTIEDLEDEPFTDVSIYDRFGKLIKTFKPSSERGWDGTMNGEKLPATDYWFIVKYNYKGQNKEYKSHFSLKR